MSADLDTVPAPDCGEEFAREYRETIPAPPAMPIAIDWEDV